MKPDPKHEAWLKYTDVLQFFESASFEMVFKAGWQARDNQDSHLMGMMKDELNMHIKMFELINEWGLAGNILHYRELTDKLEELVGE